MKNTVRAIGNALGSPGKAFSGEEYYKARRILLILILYICYLAAGLMSVQSQRTETFQQIQYDTAMQSVEKRMVGATEEQMENARAAVRDQLSSPTQRIIETVSIVIFSWFALVFVLLTWLITIVMSRMLGGEETPLEEKKHRRTFYMNLYAAIPMAISGIIGGILILTKNPESYASILTMSDYIQEMQVTPSLYYIFRPAGFEPGIFLGSLLATLTDPFMWWGYIILFQGLKSILRLDGRKAVIIISTAIIAGTGLVTLIQLPAKLMGG